MGQLPGTCVLSGVGCSGDVEFSHGAPLAVFDLFADDLGGLGEVLGEFFFHCFEVFAGNVGFSSFVGECFEEDVGVGVFDAAGPFEPEVAFFGSGRFGEGAADFWPVICVFGFDEEFDVDEDHAFTLTEVGDLRRVSCVVGWGCHCCVGAGFGFLVSGGVGRSAQRSGVCSPVVVISVPAGADAGEGASAVVPRRRERVRMRW
ncbi:Uncharacterised protein [Dermatophilus congolensis]|uniref:Uncharacterized protein n=1 Tax=Dermatophilus congolensis TaxID=1863 RepID=A0AA46BMQ9_9MICO|nr:Uncharacterised protein [Dermatophilus congolensis]